MSDKNKKPAFAKYAVAAVAALLIIGVTVTTVMIKAKRKEVVVIDPNSNNVENTDSSDAENKKDNKQDKAEKTVKTVTEKPVETKQTSVSVSFPIDINKADLSQLCAIEGVGSSTAQRILDYRTKVGVISSLDMLLNVEGIGKKTLTKLENYLYVAESDKAATTPAQTTTKPSKAITAPLVTTAKQLSQVNINTADAVEISQALLISLEKAQKIVDTREKIGGYVTKPEIMLSQAITQSEFVELEKYILI